MYLQFLFPLIKKQIFKIQTLLIKLQFQLQPWCGNIQLLRTFWLPIIPLWFGILWKHSVLYLFVPTSIFQYEQSSLGCMYDWQKSELSVITCCCLWLLLLIDITAHYLLKQVTIVRIIMQIYQFQGSEFLSSHLLAKNKQTNVTNTATSVIQK